MTSTVRANTARRVDTYARWRIRRNMAFLSFGFVIFQTVTIVLGAMSGALSVEHITALGVVLGGSYTFHTFVITSYYGFATYDDTRQTT